MTHLARREHRLAFPDLLDWAESLPSMIPWSTTVDPKAVRIEHYMTDGAYVVRAEIPGIDPEEDLKVDIDNGVLTIHAERKEEQKERYHTEFRYGSFTRRIALPTGADEDQVAARYDNGILEITVPVTEKQPQAREIKVERS